MIERVDDRVVVGGFFAGAITLGKRQLSTKNGDGFFAVVNAGGEIETSWHAAGPGREEITALSAIPGGFVAGIAHSAALQFDDDQITTPGAAIIGRPAP